MRRVQISVDLRGDARMLVNAKAVIRSKSARNFGVAR